MTDIVNPKHETVLSAEQLAEIAKGEAVELQPMADGELAPVRNAENIGLATLEDSDTDAEQPGEAAPNHEQFCINGVPVAPLASDGLPAFVTLQLVKAKIIDEVCTVIEGTGAAIVNLHLQSGMSVQGFANFTPSEMRQIEEQGDSPEQKAIDVARANAMVKAMEIEAYVLADYRYTTAAANAAASQAETAQAEATAA